jgi:hypothetical protein
MHGISALLGALIGFLAAITPEFLGMLKDRFSHQRQLEAKQQEMDAAAKGFEYTIDSQNSTIEQQTAQLAFLQRQVQEAEIENDKQLNDHPVLLFIRSSVRPILTYSFFALFAIIELFALHHALVVEHTPVMQIFPVIWDDDTESLFAAVISFWFGSRAVNSVSRQKDGDTGNKKVSSVLKGTGQISGE